MRYIDDFEPVAAAIPSSRQVQPAMQPAMQPAAMQPATSATWHFEQQVTSMEPPEGPEGRTYGAAYASRSMSR